MKKKEMQQEIERLQKQVRDLSNEINLLKAQRILLPPIPANPDSTQQPPWQSPYKIMCANFEAKCDGLTVWN